jgi:hypothetical protein
MQAVLVAFALGFGRGRRRRSVLEHQGEAAVRRALTKKFPGPAYHLLNHLTLLFQGGTTQIVHFFSATTRDLSVIDRSVVRRRKRLTHLDALGGVVALRTAEKRTCQISAATRILHNLLIP